MICAAIDPSLNSAGHAVLDGDKPLIYGHGPLRTAQQVQHLVDVLASFRPAVVAIENSYVAVNARTGLQLAELRGRLLQCLETKSMVVELIAPGTWRKSTIAPPAKAKRKELKALAKSCVRQLYGVEATDDEADALLIATHIAGTRGSVSPPGEDVM